MTTPDLTTTEPTTPDLNVRKVIWTAAQYTAHHLKLGRKDVLDNLWDGQLVMVATATGMTIGNIKVTHSETKTSRHEHFHLHDQLICEHVFEGLEVVWGESPEIINHLPEKSVFFAEYTFA